MRVTGFVLAGGKSSRMGQEKALLPVGAQRLIDVAVQRLRPHVERVIVIGHAGNVEQFRGLPVEAVLTDLKPDCGPLMGLYTGLMRSETPWNLFVPCDMPWISGRLLTRLLEQCGEDTEAVAGLHPVDGAQPFPLLCRLEAGRTVGALLDRGERSLRAFLRCPQTRLVRVEEPELLRSFANVNTPADYRELIDAYAVASRP